MKTATPVNAITILEDQTLPNGVKVLIVPCPGYEALEQLPQAVSYDGQVYGRTGWNSDRLVAYFRTDAKVAIQTAGQDVAEKMEKYIDANHVPHKLRNQIRRWAAQLNS